jgi:hypothetical protein
MSLAGGPDRSVIHFPKRSDLAVAALFGMSPDPETPAMSSRLASALRASV